MQMESVGTSFRRSASLRSEQGDVNDIISWARPDLLASVLGRSVLPIVSCRMMTSTHSQVCASQHGSPQFWRVAGIQFLGWRSCWRSKRWKLDDLRQNTGVPGMGLMASHFRAGTHCVGLFVMRVVAAALTGLLAGIDTSTGCGSKIYTGGSQRQEPHSPPSKSG